MKRGFTILEITFSVAILSIVLLGSLASVHYGMKSQQYGRNMSEAGSYASRLLEIMAEENRAFSTVSMPVSSSGYQDAPSARQQLDAAPFNGSSYGLPANSRFRRNISVIACRAAGESGTQYGWKDDLRQVTVSIYWYENQKERSVSLRCYSKLSR
ncbi:type II secretion system protein [bacterium]|nr:type II secretion system protein [bacterium]